MVRFRNTILVFFFICTLVVFFFINQKKIPPSFYGKHKKIINNEELTFILDKIPQEDKKSLELLFRYLFSEGFSYSLFGNKSMALSGYYVVKFYDNNQKKFYPLYEIAQSIYNAYHPKNIEIKKGWKLWKKYSQFFPSSQYIFLEEPNPWNEKTLSIILINKTAFIHTLNLYKDDFQKILRDSADPEMILNNCLKGEKLLSNILHKHNGLIGVLLHYGRNNAWNFYQREQLFKCKEASFEIENKIQLLNKKLLMFAPHDYEDIEKLLEETDGHDSDEFTYLYLLPQYMTLPVFSADPDDNETKQLKHEYEESRKKVQSIYLNKNFLEETLKQIVFG